MFEKRLCSDAGPFSILKLKIELKKKYYSKIRIKTN